MRGKVTESNVSTTGGWGADFGLNYGGGNV